MIYQIYPRSFQDSNGDGIGRSAGDHCPSAPHCGARRGRDLDSPFFTSPMRDFVTTSRTMSMSILSSGARRLRCADRQATGSAPGDDRPRAVTYSDQHPWFVESAPAAAMRKRTGILGGFEAGRHAPNNWLSIFGGPPGKWDHTRLQYYLHNFLTSQPTSICITPGSGGPACRRALLAGAGRRRFPADTINFYFHDRELRDQPRARSERRNASTAPAVNPYNYQEHIYDKNAAGEPGVPEALPGR